MIVACSRFPVWQTPAVKLPLKRLSPLGVLEPNNASLNAYCALLQQRRSCSIEQEKNTVTSSCTHIASVPFQQGKMRKTLGRAVASQATGARRCVVFTWHYHRTATSVKLLRQCSNAAVSTAQPRLPLISSLEIPPPLPQQPLLRPPPPSQQLPLPPPLPLPP